VLGRKVASNAGSGVRRNYADESVHVANPRCEGLHLVTTFGGIV
jgi:hypothetical protein